MDLRGGGGVARKKGWCFRGGVDTPMHTMHGPDCEHFHLAIPKQYHQH